MGPIMHRVDEEDPHDGKPITLQSCIEAFTESETLSESDAWYCSSCKDFKCATKKLDLYSSPDILIIHLKRFSYTRQHRDRINTLVQFPPDNLDITNYVLDPESKKDAIYKLYAVSNHMGGMGGGHYTAYAKNLKNEQWYHLDDTRATQVHDLSHIVSPAAYVLYYTRTQPRQARQRADDIRVPDANNVENDANNDNNINNANEVNDNNKRNVDESVTVNDQLNNENTN